MEIKALKRIGTFEQYRLKRFKDLDNKLLVQLHKNWPAGATHAVFQFGEPIKNEWRVTKLLLPKYNAALIYSARPSAVKAVKIALPETLERGRLSLNKTIALYKKILTGYHKKIKKLGPAYKAEMKTALKAVRAARTETLLKGGAQVTLFASYRRVNYVGKTCEWLLTGWGDPKLSKREAEFVDEDFWGFIKKSRLPVDFKTRSFMRESQEQARSRGFKPSYVTIAKMP
jgi:hypothetical protein